MADKPIEEMTPEELEEYEKTLSHELKLREVKEMKAKLEEMKKLEEEKAREAELSVLKEKWEEEFYAEHPEFRPTSKIENTRSDVKNGATSPMQLYFNGYFERNKVVTSETGYERKLEMNSPDMQFQLVNSGKFDVVGFNALFENTDSDTGCEDDVSAWSPEDVYARIVWNTFVAKADLMKIAVKGLAINPGDGLSVQIRVYGAFGSPVEKAACECGSCASISFTTYTLTLKQYNLEAIVCDKDIFDAGSIVMDSYIQSMSDSWAAWADYMIYSELKTATPGLTKTLAHAVSATPSVGGSCCTDTSLVELYDAIRTAKASMKEGTSPYKPDYIIMSPSVAAIFGRMQTPTAPGWIHDVVFDEDGNLKKICGLKVIEYARATSASSTSGAVLAIIVDSRRAVGAVFGQNPKMYKFFQTNCNSYRIDWWAYFAVGELDTNAICHIKNP